MATEEAAELFRVATKDTDLSTEWRVAEGDPVGHLALSARYADLTVIG